MNETADILVVGAGAAGAAFAWRLAGVGLKVVCIERGDWIDQRKSPSVADDWELALQTRFHGNPNVRRGAADHPVDDADSAFTTATIKGYHISSILVVMN